MHSRLKRAWFPRTTVAALVFGLSLLAAGSAQAAIAGALAPSSTFRPDLVSTTLVGTTAAQFCFDKIIDPSSVPPSGAGFALGGYKSDDGQSTLNDAVQLPTSASLDDNNAKCVDVVFASAVKPDGNGTGNNSGSTGKAELAQYTIGQVAVGVVKTASHAETNNGDSVPLTGSTTNNGTRGNSVAPDLLGVTVNTTFNTVTYTFNKNVGGVDITSSLGFFIVNSAGQVCRVDTGDVPGGSATAITFSGNTVTVPFPTTSTGDCSMFTAFPKSTSAAVRAGVDPGVVSNATADGTPNSDTPVAIVPGTSGTTAQADLLTAVLAPNGNAITFTFDKPIGSVSGQNDFYAVSSDGVRFVAGSGGATISGNSVTVPTPPGGTSINEYLVKAGVLPGAVTVLNEAGSTDTYGSVPIGDNSGAFARGFTTGPDATSVAFNDAAGTAVVTFDQRVTATAASNFVLLDGDGTPIAGAVATGATFSPAPAGPMQVTVSFPPAAFGTPGPTTQIAKQLEICGEYVDFTANGFTTPAECGTGTGSGACNYIAAACTAEGWPNVQQILSPFATSAIVKGSTVHHAAKLSRRAFARRLAAAQHRALARHHRHHR